MKNKSIIYVDNLSIFALPQIVKIAYKGGGARIRFWKSHAACHMILKFAKMVNVVPVEIEKITRSLGDMWIGNQSMGRKIDFDLPEMTIRTFQVLKKRQIYKTLCEILPEERLDIFFENEISYEIYSIVRLLLIARWYKSRDKGGRSETIILYPDFGLFSAVKEIWPDSDISPVSHKCINLGDIKNRLKILLYKRKPSFCSNRLNGPQDNNYKIAVHYVEGIDLKRRSDMFWYPNSNIDPERLLIYFDLVKTLRKPIQEEVCKKIEEMGIRWVALRRGAIDRSGRYAWRALENTGENKINISALKTKGASSCLDKWLVLIARRLIANIEYWIAFYRAFNIRIVVDIVSQSTKGMAQSMAVDFVKGIRIGFQRTALLRTEHPFFLRYNSNHVLFSWGEEAAEYKGTSKAVKRIVISGFPFDEAFRRNSLEDSPRKRLKGNGIKLVIALFDNAFGTDMCFSQNIMEEFYSAFLKWLIEDKEIAIIAKEKKPIFYNRLTGIRKLISQAYKTGRYVRLENALGRLSSDASSVADIAVGIGISSAAEEAVIIGRRGIHCDLTKHHFHPFYGWGYKKIIFDDIEGLIEALKRYKENPANEPELGNWSSHIDRVEPFRDGKGGERIGIYVRWLLESLDKGKSRDEAIQYADGLYAEKWGEDKIINLKHGAEDRHKLGSEVTL